MSKVRHEPKSNVQMKIALAGVIEEHHTLYNDIFNQMKSALLADPMPRDMGLKQFLYL